MINCERICYPAEKGDFVTVHSGQYDHDFHGEECRVLEVDRFDCEALVDLSEPGLPFVAVFPIGELAVMGSDFEERRIGR
jgi:hypothetical protein